MKNKIIIIAAVAENRVIGHKNKMPWYLPKELEYFKQITSGNIVVMGRKTYDAIGKNLPDRINIVFSRKKTTANTVSSIDELFHLIRTEHWQSKKIFIIGGAEIFSMFIPIADSLYLTKIAEKFEGDTYFPEFNEDEWELVEKKEGIKDEENPHTYHFTIYERKKNSSLAVNRSNGSAFKC